MKNERLLPLFALTVILVVFLAGLLVGRTTSRTPVQIQPLSLSSVHDQASVSPVTSNVPVSDKPININTATAEQLQTLPGSGPALAKRIIAYRREHGPFGSVAELINVSGIGEKKLESIWNLITTGG